MTKARDFSFIVGEGVLFLIEDTLVLSNGHAVAIRFSSSDETLKQSATFKEEGIQLRKISREKLHNLITTCLNWRSVRNDRQSNLLWGP